MHTGIVRSLRHDDGTWYGHVTSPETGKVVYFLMEEGRTFHPGTVEPFFDGQKPESRVPKEGDLIVFQRADPPKGRDADQQSAQQAPRRGRRDRKGPPKEGPLATPWGLYQSYREAFAPSLEPHIPEYARAEHPFLLDVLIAAKRLFKPGPFAFRTEPLTRAIYRSTPVDDLTAFKCSYYFVALYQDNGTWLVRELTTSYVYKGPDGIKRSLADPVSKQLDQRFIKLWRNKYVLVRVHVDQRIGLLTPGAATIPKHIAEEERSLVVFL